MTFVVPRSWLVTVRVKKEAARRCERKIVGFYVLKKATPGSDGNATGRAGAERPAGPLPNGRRIFSRLGGSRGVDRAELRASLKTHLLSASGTPGRPRTAPERKPLKFRRFQGIRFNFQNLKINRKIATEYGRRY